MIFKLFGFSNSCDYQIINYTTANGLSHNTITCVYQDSKGYVWIGTSNGLNRFDGSAFKNFLPNPKDSSTLQGINIEDVVEDTKGLIWISCEEGIFYYNPEYESFHKIKLFDDGGNIGARKLCVDNDGNVWTIVKNNKLVSLNLSSHPIKKILNLDSLIHSENPNEYYRIRFIDNFLWISGTNGLIRLNKDNYDFTKVLYSKTDLRNSREIKKGKDNSILLINGDLGVYIIDTKTLKHQLYKKEQLSNEVFNVTLVSDAEYNSDGSLIIGGFPGLFSISEDGTICRYNDEKNQVGNFDKTIVSCMFKDRNDNLFIGTYYDGFYIINRQTQAFTHFTLKTKDMNGVHTRKIHITESRIYCVNLYGAFYIEKDTKKTVTISNNPMFSISGNPVNSDIIILYTSNQMYFFNEKTNNLTLYKNIPPVQDSYIDSRGIIWITHWGEIFDGYDLKNDKIYTINVDNSSSENNFIYTLVEDKDSSLWLGTFGAGLIHVINPLSDIPVLKQYSSQKTKNSLSHNVIISLYDDGRGSLWIGTNGGGLNRFNKRTETFEIFNKENGLQSNVIGAIFSDSKNNIWFLSTEISKYDQKLKSFTHFAAIDGVPSKYFSGSVVKDSDGRYYLGDDRGVLSFNPLEINQSITLSTPVCTRLTLFGTIIKARQVLNGMVPLEKSIEFTDTIRLPYSINTLALSFSSLNIVHERSLDYYYKIDGIHDEWLLVNNDRTLAFTELQPGEYTIRVKVSNNKIEWSNEKVIHLVITPPIYLTWWFRILVAISVIVSTGLIIYFRIRSIKRLNKQLENKVYERTKSLEQSNELLQESKIFMEVKNSQLSESIHAKDKLISVIAHDFKNALGSILGISQLLQKESKKNNLEKIEKYSDTICTTTDTIINQMKTILEWAQSQDADLVANPIEVNLETIMEDVIALENISAINKSISIKTQTDYNKTALVDPRMASMVFRNILTNALKFTQKGGSIIVIIQELESTIDTTIIDSGPGIKQHIVDSLDDKQNSIKPEFGTENEKGQGLGLKLCKVFVEKNSGLLHISNYGHGTIVTVSFPKGQKRATRTRNFIPEITESESKSVDLQINFSILIIDDFPEIVEIIETSLSSNYKIIKARDGRDGLNIAQHMLPDLVICDIDLPFKNGIEVCKTIKNNNLTSHIPVILISSYSDEDTKNQAYACGANDFIEKPFNLTHLKQKVDSILQDRKTLSKKLKKELNSNMLLPDNFDNKIIKKVLEYVNQNLSNEQLNANMVAEVIGISRTQMWRIFKNSTGKTLSDYILDIRMQKAATMLQSGDYRINEIAYEIGFTDPRYFSRCFGKEFGMTPTEYAENLEKGKIKHNNLN